MGRGEDEPAPRCAFHHGEARLILAAVPSIHAAAIACFRHSSTKDRLGIPLIFMAGLPVQA
jgi:hypothetical protein